MSSVSQLNNLYQESWEFFLKEYPRYATYLGDHRYDDKLEDASEEAFNRRVSQSRIYLDRLHETSKPTTTADRLNYELFERRLGDEIEEVKFRPQLLPITQQDGPHLEVPQIISYQPFHSTHDYENYCNRLRRFPRLIDQVISNMRTGIKAHLVPARINVEEIIPELEAHIIQDAQKSEMFKPITNPPKDMPPEDVRALKSSLEEIISAEWIPTYTKLRDFVRDEYLPASRSEVGIWSLPDGRDRYLYYVHYYTTTNLSPDSIHEIGCRELAGIHEEMRAIMNQLGFKGTLQEFITHLRNDKSQYNTSAQAYLEGFKGILTRMDEKLPLLFGHLPETKYGFREIEKYRAEAAPDAYYYSPPEDKSRPGYFYVNTYKPETRPKYTMEALAYHEAVPGHHLQLAIQLELTELPKFRRHGGYTAFVEGWGLYSEQLPKEIGFYKDLYSDFGRLTLEAWRAARLVVDTGMHSKRWTREQAIEFFKENTALSEHNIISEVDRYIAWPAQALAYKIGQMKIREIRAKTEKHLGSRFDLRAFHDELLNDGALALDVLESKMERWLEGAAAA